MDLDMKLKFKEKAIAARKFAERKYNINNFSC